MKTCTKHKQYNVVGTVYEDVYKPQTIQHCRNSLQYADGFQPSALSPFPLFYCANIFYLITFVSSLLSLVRLSELWVLCFLLLIGILSRKCDPFRTTSVHIYFHFYIILLLPIYEDVYKTQTIQHCRNSLWRRVQNTNNTTLSEQFMKTCVLFVVCTRLHKLFRQRCIVCVLYTSS
jgi:hypothetical protein